MFFVDSVNNDARLVDLDLDDYILKENSNCHPNTYDHLKYIDPESQYSSSYATLPGYRDLSPKFPFRNNSHYGFNNPKYVEPYHFHITLTPTKYIPLTQELSVDELFSTKKYLNFPDSYVPKILNKKRMSLKNFRKKSFKPINEFIKRQKLSPSKITSELYNKQNCSEYASSFNTDIDFIASPSEEKINDRVENDDENVDYCGYEQKNAKMNDYSEPSGNYDTEFAFDGDGDVSINSSIFFDNNMPITKFLGSSFCDNERLDKIEALELDKLEESAAKFVAKWINEIITDVLNNNENVIVLNSSNNCAIVNKSRFSPKIQKIKNPDNKTQIHSNNINPIGVTFFKKLSELAYSTESPNIIHNQQKITNTLYVPENSSLSGKIRKVLGRDKRHERREEFIEIWEDHLNYVTNKEYSIANNVDIMTEQCGNRIVSRQFDAVEQQILSKIDFHALDLHDQIFSTIKKSIIESNNSKLHLSAHSSPVVLQVPEITKTEQNRIVASSTPTELNETNFHSFNLSEVSSVEVHIPVSKIPKLESSIIFKGRSVSLASKNSSNAVLSCSVHKAISNYSKSDNFFEQDRRSVYKSKERITDSGPSFNVKKYRSKLRNKPIGQKDYCSTNNEISKTLKTITTKKKHRNFIAENIVNVSHKKIASKPIKKMQVMLPLQHSKLLTKLPACKVNNNFGAIFSKNPFSIECVTTNEPETLLKQHDIISFQTNESKNGSPRIWVSIPSSNDKNNNTHIDCTEGLTELTEFHNSQKNLPKNKNTFSKLTPKFERNIESINTVKLKDVIDKCGQHIDNLPLDQIQINLDEIIEIHTDIDHNDMQRHSTNNVANRV